MRSKIFNSVLVTSLLSGGVFASDVLSSKQKDSLKYTQKKAINDSEKLSNDWINPISYTYSYSDNEGDVTQSSAISINQPIFRSGGIYHAIKYAKNIKNSSEISIDIQKKMLIKQALNIAYTIKKTELQMEQQKLAIENAKIDLRIKKESVMNGLLDTSFLNNAIITLNAQKAKLLELQYAKSNLELSLDNLSDKKASQIDLPTFSKISLDQFNKNNLEVQKSRFDVESTNNTKWMTQANYLPSVSLNYSYTKYHDVPDSSMIQKGDTNQMAGFQVIVPLDIKTFDAIDSAKAEYLRAKSDLEILTQENINFFKSQDLKINMIDNKINLTKQNISSYNELLIQMEELAGVGMKTADDVALLANSKKTEKINLEIFEIEKQIELLEIYGKIASDKI